MSNWKGPAIFLTLQETIIVSPRPHFRCKDHQITDVFLVAMSIQNFDDRKDCCCLMCHYDMIRTQIVITQSCCVDWLCTLRCGNCAYVFCTLTHETDSAGLIDWIREKGYLPSCCDIRQAF